MLGNFENLSIGHKTYCLKFQTYTALTSVA